MKLADLDCSSGGWQMVLHPDGALTSLVQVRGSIPLFWSSPADLSYTPRVRMHGTMLQVSQQGF